MSIYTLNSSAGVCTLTLSFSVDDLVASSSVVADGKQLNTALPLLSHCIGEPMVARKKHDTVFGGSVLGYCKNMAVQHGGLHERGPTAYVEIKGSF